MDQIYNFYKRDKGKVVPVNFTKKNFKKAEKIIDEIIKDNLKLIPKKILKQRAKIKL